MTDEVTLLSVSSVPASTWDASVPGSALQYRHDYLSYRSFAEPGEYWLAGIWRRDRLLAGAPFFLTTPRTATFSSPWRLLTSAQFRRESVGDVAAAALSAEHERHLSALAPGAASAETLHKALGEVLVCRYYDHSAVVADRALDAIDRAAVIRSIASHAQDVARDGLAAAVAFPFALRSDHMLRECLRGLGFSSGIITAHTMTSLPKDIHEIDDYLPSLSKNGRRRFRAELSRLRQAGITLKTIPLSGNELAVAELEAQTQSRHGGRASPEDIARLRRRMVEDLGDAMRVAAAYDGTKLIACGIDMLDANDYYGLTYGCDYSHSNLSTTYMCVAYYDPIMFCLARGIGRLRYGFEAFEPKMLRGASLTPLEFWIWAPDDKVNRALADLLSFLDHRSRRYLGRWLSV